MFSTESDKYCEDADGFVYKKVNENQKTVYYDCLDEPRCLVAARFYKQSKSLKLFGNHSEYCPPDAKTKLKIHFEEHLKKAVLADENKTVSVLNIYKRAINDRYTDIWLPINHQSDFLPVLRRLRTYNKNKPKKSEDNETKKKDAATSPIVRNEVIAPTENSDWEPPMLSDDGSKATTSNIESVVVNRNDMATSPMHTSWLNQSKSADNGNSIEHHVNASLDTVQNIDIRVVSNGDSTLSIVASSSLSALESNNSKVNNIY